MANKASSGARSPLSLVVAMALCCFFYVLGAWQGSGYGKGDRIAAAVSRQTACGDGSAAAEGLSFETHHGGAAGINASTSLPFGADAEPPTFAPCAAALADHTPCHDQDRAMKFPRKNMVYRERHCPADGERLRCLMPAPPGYVTPFPWPQSRDYVPFANAPYKSLTVEKAVQNWVQYEGSVFRFPGGGTQFPPRHLRIKMIYWKYQEISAEKGNHGSRRAPTSTSTSSVPSSPSPAATSAPSSTPDAHVSWP
ncbi:probable methyltransferase PMT14 isoform X1 [Miscanthus floridulus]|uniref:probable methyltransferase PMT14 isoform X1 n=1 Tax=Miscanthus floridulus TaxID=154761 RepID=UPI0034578D1A